MHKITLKYSIYTAFFLFLMFCRFGTLHAQVPVDTTLAKIPAFDSGYLGVVGDTSLPSTAVVDLSRVRIANGALDDKITYSADDSIWFDVKRKQVHLYGNAQVLYTSINLKAGYILLDYENNTITGKPIIDSLGRETGIPEFSDKDQKFSAKELKYNFKTKKGIIKEVYTTQESLYVLGKKAKFIQNTPKDSTEEATNTIYNESALLTTCDHPEPHFGIRAKKLKVVPDKLVVIGPSLVEIGGVPTPLVLPFGFFPITKTRTQGLIIPKDFNLNDSRGLGIRDFGYYLPLGPNADLKFLLDYYLRGSHTVSATSRYSKRYKYNGDLNLSYSNNIGEDELSQKFSVKSWSIRWSHNQDSKANPYHKFGGSIDIETNRDERRNNNDFRSVYNNNRNSSLTYSRIFAGKPYSLQSSFTHSQVTSTRRMTVNFPNIDFNMRQIFPFKSKKIDGEDKWFERISLTYSSRFRNTFTGTDSIFFRRTTLDSAQFAAEHRASSDFQFKLFKYINVAPRVSYQESWYWRTMERSLDTTILFKYDTIIDNGVEVRSIDTAATKWGTVQTDIVKGFKPFRSFEAGISANTSLYATKQFKGGLLRGIRHVVTPSAGLNFAPDFTKEKYNYFREYTTDVRADRADTLSYSIFDQGQFGRPSNSAPALSIGYSLRNVLELKYFSKKDTISKKLPLFNNLTFSGSYSLTADSLKWSQITTGSAIRLFKGFTTLNWNVAFDPYVYDAQRGRRLNRYLYKENGKLVRVSTLGVIINTGATIKQIRDLFNRDKTQTNAPANAYNDDLGGLIESFRFSHYFALEKVTLRDNTDSIVISRNNVGISGDIPLTAMWGFRVNNISYDLISKKLVYPDIAITRDLHCWEMALGWQPERGTYSFQINVKNAPLDFLKLPYRKLNSDKIFGL
jgi:LptD protein